MDILPVVERITRFTVCTTKFIIIIILSTYGGEEGRTSKCGRRALLRIYSPDYFESRYMSPTHDIYTI